MKKIDFKIIKPDSIGILHDSRKDVRSLALVCNKLIDKINELIDENERIKKIISSDGSQK